MPGRAEKPEPMSNETLPLQRFMTYRMSRVQAKLNAQATRILKRIAGLSLAQWRILALLGSRGRASSSELTRISTMDKGLFSRKLKTLVAQGLVRAETDKRDHRIQHLSLTEQGQAIYDQTLPHMRARQAFLQRDLTEAELAAFHKALDLLEIAADATEFAP